MIEPELEDLVNREIDGRLTREEEAALGALIAARPDVRAYREELRGAAQVLDRAGLQDPPPRMIGEIMRRVRETPRGGRAGAGVPAARVRHGAGRTAALRYALALAAGLALGGVSVALVGGGLLRWGAGGEGLGATMLPGDRLAGARETDRAAIELPGVRGAVAARRAGDVVLAEIQVDAPGPAELTLAFDPGALSPRGLERLGGQGEATLSERGLRLAFAGAVHYRLTLEGGASPLWVTLKAGDAVVEKTLETRAGP